MLRRAEAIAALAIRQQGQGKVEVNSDWEITGKLNEKKLQNKVPAFSFAFSSPLIGANLALSLKVTGEITQSTKSAQLLLPGKTASHPTLTQSVGLFGCIGDGPELNLCSEYLGSPVCISATRWQMFTATVSAC